MPNISLEISKLDKEKKRELIRRLTETASEVTHIPPEAFTVYLKEFEPENIGVGGKPLDEVMRSGH